MEIMKGIIALVAGIIAVFMGTVAVVPPPTMLAIIPTVIFGVIGMLAGAAVYAEFYPLLKGNLLSVCDLGKVTIPEITGLSPWVFVIALVVLSVVVFAILKRMEPSFAIMDEGTDQSSK